MQNNRNLLIGVGVGVIVIVIVIAVGTALYARSAGQGSTPAGTPGTAGAASTGAIANATGTMTAAATASTSADGLPVIPGAIVTPIYAAGTASGAKVPDYSKPLSYADVSADLAGTYEASFGEAQAALAKDATDWGAWISLGQLRKATGDYAGAQADWQYLTAIYPRDPTAYANLGDLYANYLHDPAKAIAAYQEAISLDPVKEATFYENLADTLIADDQAARAKAVLQEGIDAKVVGYQNLQTKLASIQ